MHLLFMYQTFSFFVILGSDNFKLLNFLPYSFFCCVVVCFSEAGSRCAALASLYPTDLTL